MLTADKFDGVTFRNALGHYASGITVITGLHTGQPVGFTCQSFYSVSLEPPLVSFCVRGASNSWPLLRPSGRFAVNVLSHDQEALSTAFARSVGDRWSGVEWTGSGSGMPFLNGALLSIDCEIYAEHDAGDHQIIVGRVNSFSLGDEGAECLPLLYYQGKYASVSRACCDAR